jgi:hypothetical protein
MGWKAWQISKLKNRRVCPRCSLKYDKTLATCPHCSELDSNGLAQLKLQIELNQQANTRMGKRLIYLALIMLIALLVLNNQQ